MNSVSWTGKNVEGNHGGSDVGTVANFVWRGHWVASQYQFCTLRAAEFQTLVAVSIACCAEINRRALPSVNWCSQLSASFSNCNCRSVAAHWSGVFSGVRKTVKATISFGMSVLTEKTRLPPDGCLWNLIFEYFSIICRESSSLTNIWQE
jgi:hypothetical protein